MDPLREIDLTTATAFSSTQEFETAASTQEEYGVLTYMLGWFITRMKQQVDVMPLDLLMSVLFRTAPPILNKEVEGPDLGLISTSAIVLSGQGLPKEKPYKARAALLQNTCEYLLSRTAENGSSHGRLQRAGDIILLPFPPPLPKETAITGKNRGPLSEIGITSSDTYSSNMIFGGTTPRDQEKEARPLRTAITQAKHGKLRYSHFDSPPIAALDA